MPPVSPVYTSSSAVSARGVSAGPRGGVGLRRVSSSSGDAARLVPVGRDGDDRDRVNLLGCSLNRAPAQSEPRTQAVSAGGAGEVADGSGEVAGGEAAAFSPGGDFVLMRFTIAFAMSRRERVLPSAFA